MMWRLSFFCSPFAKYFAFKTMTLSRLRTVVSTNWLRDRIGSQLQQQKVAQDLRVLDTSFKADKDIDCYREFYAQGHIPQSLFFDLHKCVDSTPEIPRNLPDVNCFTDYARSLGIWPDTHIVAYDRFGPLSSYRTWWLFRLYGHKRVSILDGGLYKWVQDGFEVSQDVPEVEPSNFEVEFDGSLRRTYDDMLENLKTGREQVVDARARDHPTVTDVEEHDGGRIPGARNISFDELFNEDKTIKSDAELKAMFDAAGVDLGKPLVSSCQTGMTACGLAAAAHILGKPRVPVYYGAWLEWRSRAPEDLKERVQLVKSEE